MSWLEAFLAFALTMIVFSTMVTAVMEIVHRFLNSREAGFQLMVQRLFDQVIWPRVQRRLAGSDPDQLRARFVEAMTLNPVAADRQLPVGGSWAMVKRAGIHIANRVEPTNVAGMSVMEFMERLADSEVGQALAMEGEAYVLAAINDLTQKYDRFCAGAKEVFYNKARVWSVAASFLLAFSINVDAVRLFRTYLQDQPLRQAVIEQQDSIEREMRVAQATLKEVQSDTARGPANKAELEKIESRIKDVQAGVTDLKTMGVPVGYDYYPWCAGKKSDGTFIDSQCPLASNNWTATLKFLAWVFSVLLAGLLIGLGAPFWFDLATGLSNSLKLLKAMGAGEKSEKGEETGRSVPAGADVPPRTPVEAFRTAIAASVAPKGTRLLLSPAGEIIKGE